MSVLTVKITHTHTRVGRVGCTHSVGGECERGRGCGTDGDAVVKNKDHIRGEMTTGMFGVSGLLRYKF